MKVRKNKKPTPRYVIGDTEGSTAEVDDMLDVFITT